MLNMGRFRTATSKHQENLTEEYLYGVVSNEMSNGVISQGLYAKAVYEAEGDERKAKARYIKLRVNSVRAEAEALVEVNEELQRERKQLAATQSKAVDAPRRRTPVPSTPLPKPPEPFSIAGSCSPAETRKAAAMAAVPTCAGLVVLYFMCSSAQRPSIGYILLALLFTAFWSVCSYLLWREAGRKEKAIIDKEEVLRKSGIPTREEWAEYVRRASQEEE